MRSSPSTTRLQTLAMVFLLFTLWLQPQTVQAGVASEQTKDSALPALIEQFFPTATRIEPPHSNPPIWTAYQLNEIVGYAFATNDFVDLKGFSGERINLFIGLDAQGRFAGLHILNHHEPIFLHGLGPEPLNRFINQYLDRSLAERLIIGNAAGGDTEGNIYLDGVTKATVSVMVINDTIISAAREVAREKLAEFAQAAPAQVKTDTYQPLGWQELLDQQLVKQWAIDKRTIEQALDQPLSDFNDPQLHPTANAVTLYYAYLNTPLIGRNLLGNTDYQQLMESLGNGEHAILVMSTGLYDYLGEDFKPGTQPERIALVQHKLPIGLRDMNFFHMQDIHPADNMPVYDNLRLFKIKPQAGFDPASPMSLMLTMTLQKNYLIQHTVEFSSDYALPAALFDKVAPTTAKSTPLWLTLWKSRMTDILVLCSGLVILTFIFIFQRSLVKNSQRFSIIRTTFLVFTLFFIGFYAQGQLSVVNIFTLLLAIANGFDISVFLLDPIIFILWCYTIATLILWGRGVFCGWLCPFGVLQEWTAALANRLHIKQFNIKPTQHKRLLWVKYVVLIGLTATAFYSLTLAEKLAEIEPFKTAITLLFIRSLPFVLYALLILGIGLFIHKFYCRYLCPLGAGLSILGKLHIFKWLDRRQECGSPCQLCRKRCGINAIEKSGEIDYNECIQCLECVVIIHDPKQCAPAITKNKQSSNTSGIAATVIDN